MIYTLEFVVIVSVIISTCFMMPDKIIKWIIAIKTVLTVKQCSGLSLSSSVRVLYDSTNNRHCDLQYHPENCKRIEVCVTTLRKFKESETSDSLDIIDIGKPENDLSQDELSIAREILVETHTEEYVYDLENRCLKSREARIAQNKIPLGFIGYLDGSDTFLSTYSYDVCLRATAVWLRAVEDSISNTLRINFALTRPPGHHATKSNANGFCIFNFAAAAAIFAMKKGLKVSVLDWDVHYGQGISEILKAYPNARYASLHQNHAFPYEGTDIMGISGEYSNILTMPVKMYSNWEDSFSKSYIDIALPFIHTKGEWEPDIVIVSAGYDALKDDELASVNLNPEDYAQMVHLLRKRVGYHTPLVLGLEGGYQLRYVGIRDAVLETVKALLQ